MFTFILIIHIILCLFLILLVLVQSGKGAQLGAAFGGNGQTGVSTPETFIEKLTYIIGGVVIVTSIVLFLLSRQSGSGSILDNVDTNVITQELKVEEQEETTTPSDTIVLPEATESPTSDTNN